MTTVDIEQGSESWFAIRAGKITGTRFATCMMGDTTKGYKDLINELAGETISGTKDDTYSNAIMQRGIDMEPEARFAYEQITGNEVEEVGFCLMDEYEDWVGISPDGLIHETEGIIEIKCPLIKTHVGYIEKGVLPNEYKWQVHGNMMVTGAKYCDFVSYYPNMKEFVLRVVPDEEMQKQLTLEIKKVIEQVKIKILMYNSYTTD